MAEPNLYNPVEWFAWMYGKAFQNHVYLGGAAVMIGFSLLGLLFWIRGVDRYKEVHPATTEVTANQGPKQKTVTATGSDSASQAVTVHSARDVGVPTNTQTHKSKKRPFVRPIVPTPQEANESSAQQNNQPPTLLSMGGPGPASSAQMANSVHFEGMFVQGGVNLSNCVSCSVAGSSIGRVKLGPGPILLDHNSIQGGVVCEKRDPPLKDIPNDCQAVAITNSRINDTNAALDNTDGKIGEAYISGNIVRPPVNGGAAKAVLNSHGAIQKLTETNNDVGWNPSGTVPASMPTALHGSNSAVADHLSQFIDSGNRIVADFLKDDNTASLAEKEKAWESNTRTVLEANLVQRFADQFSDTVSTSTTYPPGHGAQGGSICNLLNAKVAMLSTLVGQLRSVSHP